MGGFGGIKSFDNAEIKNAVEDYLAENPVGGLTPEQAEQIEQNTADISAISKKLEDMLARDGKIYGVRFPVASYSSSPLGERIGAAVGLTADVSTDAYAAINDFDNVPCFKNVMANGYVGTDGEFVETAVEGDANFSRDGSNGDVYSRFPLSYFRYTTTEDGNYEEWQITDTFRENAGWCPFGIFIRPDGSLRPYAYIAAYEMGYNSEGVAASISGVIPAYNTYTNMNNGITTAGLSHNTQLTEIRKKGSQYCGMTTKEVTFLQFLFCVEFATKNSQSIMAGCTNFNFQLHPTVAEMGVSRVITSNTDAAKYPVGCTVSLGLANGESKDRGYASIHSIVNRKKVTSKEVYDDNNTAIYIDNGGETFDTTVDMYLTTMPWNTGITDTVKGSSGSITSNTNSHYPMMYRGVENLYGNIYTIMSDVIISDYKAYVCYDCSKFTTTSASAGYEEVSYNLATANGYVREFGFDANHPSVHLPITTGGGSTTYYCDYFYISAGANHELLFGGNLSCGAVAGVFYWYGSLAVSFSTWSCGSRLSASGLCGRFTA